MICANAAASAPCPYSLGDDRAARAWRRRLQPHAKMCGRTGRHLCRRSSGARCSHCSMTPTRHPAALLSGRHRRRHRQNREQNGTSAHTELPFSHSDNPQLLLRGCAPATLGFKLPFRGSPGAPHRMLFPHKGICYNRPAVEGAVKPVSHSARSQRGEIPPQREESAPAPIEQRTAVAYEDASRYCPVCSQRLESRRCKLICAVCGYYMSCADYY